MNAAADKPLAFSVDGTGEEIVLSGFTAVVAGYTGRDLAAVQHHIDELAAIGVAPPPEIPMFYPMPPELFDTSGRHTGSEHLTSGEVEPVYIRHAGRYFLGIGSDHTDRDLETQDVAASKRACPKPVSRTVIAVDDLAALSLDECVARCWVDGDRYQEGTLSGLRTPKEIVDLFLERTGLGDDDFVCLGGTLPLLDGKFRAGTRWRVRLDLPGGRFLEHEYTMEKG
ncbi:DUF2848 family protein [Arthrobacter mobilis]|uniref:DUF2848 family protein n=1 Tax=Arthrobacter mobilis TaxID=2724944 RepID=A0A7X6HAV2_9MICC|nr:DUF2848 family protein [Arthrobacter mobilis]NKX53674.1 DUF2848 family protein [Arthrobacter mobilis]